jgi:hypothetical protein
MLPPRSGWTPPPAAGRAAHSGSPCVGTHLGHHIHNVPRPGFPPSLGASIVRGNPRPSFTFTDKKRACAPGLDIYEIRMMLEPVATARAAMSATGASLRPAIQLLAAAVTETDGTRWAEHNASFHDIIALAGNSPSLVAMLTNLRELSTRYITHSVLARPGPRAARQRRARGDLARRRRTRSRGGGRCGAPSSRRHAPRPADDPPARCARSRCLLGRRPGASLITCQPGSSSLRVTG